MNLSTKQAETTPHTQTLTRVRDVESGAEHIAHHEIERELQEVAPRHVRYTRTTQTCRRWTINLFCAALFILYLFARNNVALMTEVAQTGVETTASVTSKEVRSGKSTSYILHELFFHQKQSYMVTEHVRRSVYRNVSIGDKRLLTYLPRDPDICYFGRVDPIRVADRQNAWLWGILIGGLSVGSGLWLWEGYLRDRHKLLRNGFAVVGTVEKRATSEGKTTTYSMTYRYPVSGGSRTNTVGILKPAYDAFTPGTPLTILLDPARPEKSLPYVLLTEAEVEARPHARFLFLYQYAEIKIDRLPVTVLSCLSSMVSEGGEMGRIIGGFQRRQRTKGITTLALSGVLLLGAVARSQQITSDPPDSLAIVRRAVLVGNEAFVALPPDAISGANAYHYVVASHDGNYLLILQASLPPKRDMELTVNAAVPKRARMDLVLWDVAQRRASTLWRGAISETQVSSIIGIQWLPGSNTALAHVMTGQVGADGQPIQATMQQRLLLVDAARGTTRTVTTLAPATEEMPGEEVVICPTQPKAALISGTGGSVRIIGANDSVGRTFSVTVERVMWMSWRDDGRTLYGAVLPPPPPKDAPKTPRIWKTIFLDTQTGNVTVQEGKPDPKWRRDPETLSFAPLPLQTTVGNGKLVQEETTETVHPLWLSGAGKDTEGRVLLAADGGKPLILPGAVVYESQGTLFAAPLNRMDRTTFVTGRRKAYQTMTVNRAKQVALGLHMYAQDYDEFFPTPGGDTDVISPYLKNTEVFNNPETGKFGLQLVYKQANLGDYKNPATDVLGYLAGPGGRAVMYVDGHVKWEDDANKP